VSSSPSDTAAMSTSRNSSPAPASIAMMTEADLARLRTREGMKAAKAKGRLRGRQPKLTSRQEAHLVELHRAGKHTSTELAELFSVARSTVYRALARARAT